MGFDPVTAAIDAGKTVINKLFRDKASESELKQLELEYEVQMAAEARKENSDFRRFITDYEGKAKDVPAPIVYLRSSVRPLMTYLVGYFDYLFFSGGLEWTTQQGKLLFSINLLCLGFWFGEKALKKSGILEAMTKGKK